MIQNEGNEKWRNKSVAKMEMKLSYIAYKKVSLHEDTRNRNILSLIKLLAYITVEYPFYIIK